MKAAPTTKHRKASVAMRKPRPRGKRKLDLSWLLDRPLPPESELPENPVLFLRRQP